MNGKCWESTQPEVWTIAPRASAEAPTQQTTPQAKPKYDPWSVIMPKPIRMTMMQPATRIP